MTDHPDDRLDALLDDLGGLPVPPPPLRDVLHRGDQRRSRARVGLAAAVAVVLVAAGGTAYGVLHQGSPESLVPAGPTPTATSPAPAPPVPTAVPTVVQTVVPTPPTTPGAGITGAPVPTGTTPTGPVPTGTATGGPATPATTPPPSSPPTAPATQVRTVSPLTADGALAPGYRVRSTSTAAGGCGGGVAVGTAYRCFTETARYDPCFAAAGGLVLYCLPSPASHDVDEVHVPTPVAPLTPAPVQAVGGPQPWQLVLSTGEVCGLIQGAAPLFGGQIARWGCGTSTRYLLEPLDRAATAWTGRLVEGQPDTPTLPPTTTVTVATAVY